MDLWGILAPAVSALVTSGVGGVLYKFHVVDRIKNLEIDRRQILADWKTSEEKHEKAVAAAKVEAEQRENRVLMENQELRRQLLATEERWRQAVEDVGRAYMQPRKSGDPPPSAEQVLSALRDSSRDGDWDEKTGQHDYDRKKTILKSYLDKWLKQYNESTPPSQRGYKSSVDAIIIDDNAEFLREMQRFVQRVVGPRWVVEGTVDPVLGEAILVMDSRVKLAIVDLKMDKLDGVEVIEKALKERPGLRGRIIVCTGAVDLDTNHEIRRKLFDELGCLRFDKGSDLGILERLIHKTLGRTPEPFRSPAKK